MPPKNAPIAMIPIDHVQRRIYLIRGQRVILSNDLAELYGVAVRTMNQAVTRNKERFPDDFMFQLTPAEFRTLKSQSVTSNALSNTRFLRSQSVILEPDMRGKHLKYAPRATLPQAPIPRYPTPIL